MIAQIFIKKDSHSSSTRLSGELTVTEIGVSLTSNEAKEHFSFRWGQLSIKPGGANNALVFFSPLEKNHVVQSFYTDASKKNIAILKGLQSASPLPEALAEFFRAYRRDKVVNIGLLGAVGGGILGLTFALYLSFPFILDATVKQVPFEIEQKIGDKLTGIVIPPGNLITDENNEVLKTLRMQVSRLSSQLPLEMQGVVTYIAKDETLNAFALPGGVIVFNTGMLKKAESMEEVLGVAAHELSHVKERHVLKGIVQALGVYFAVDLLLGDITGVLAVITNNADLLLQNSFSRDQERQADEEGFKLLLKAGVDPIGMQKFFERILQEKELAKDHPLSKVETYLSFLSTHPETKERIAKMQEKRENLDNAKNFRPVEFDYNNFREQVRSL